MEVLKTPSAADGCVGTVESVILFALYPCGGGALYVPSLRPDAPCALDVPSLCPLFMSSLYVPSLCSLFMSWCSA
jgi:hypothetical protein